MCPLIKRIVQIDIRQQRRNNGTLRCSAHRCHAVAILNHACRQPFSNQSDYAAISNPVFQKPYHPFMINFVKE